MGTRETTAIGDPAGAFRRVTVYAGVVGWIVATTGIVVAILQAPWFTWTGHALSELGDPARASSTAFNLGLILSGALGVVFVLRVAPESENAFHWVGWVLMLATTVDLSLIGVFDITESLHGPVSVAFFVGLSFATLFYGSGEVLADRRRVGLYDIWLGIGHVTVWVLWGAGLGTSGVAIPEMVGSIAILLWVLPVTRRLQLRSAGPAGG